MTSFVPAAKKIQNAIVPGELQRLSVGHQLARSYADSLKPPTPPPVPQIDEAAQAIAQSDRLRRRMGTLANIYAGNAAAPAVGKTTLGG